jgi:serine/threonine protein kinase
MTGEDGSQPSLKRLGAYELLRPIAQGGMADIYLAKRDADGDGHTFQRHVAVKVLNKLRATEEESCAMFLDEARLVGMLHHQNIAQVLEVNVAEGHHYLAMEYVHGADLRELLQAAAKAGRTIPFEVSLSIIAGAAAGLDHAHRRCDPDGKPLRLVHRDVSLSNIMVGHDGAVKVVDFGIASTAVQTVHTSPGVVRGKASYMSPEQCLGDEVDHRTDIFALGIVLYELTTGARCFAGKSDFERMLSVVRGEYHAPTAIVSTTRRAEEVCARSRLTGAALRVVPRDDRSARASRARGGRWARRRSGASCSASTRASRRSDRRRPDAAGDHQRRSSRPRRSTVRGAPRCRRSTSRRRRIAPASRAEHDADGATPRADEDDQPTRGHTRCRAARRLTTSRLISSVELAASRWRYEPAGADANSASACARRRCASAIGTSARSALPGRLAVGNFARYASHAASVARSLRSAPRARCDARRTLPIMRLHGDDGRLATTGASSRARARPALGNGTFSRTIVTRRSTSGRSSIATARRERPTRPSSATSPAGASR